MQLSTLAYSLFLALQKVVYQCTYPGCRIAAVKSIRAIEAHVRKEHLGRAENHPDDGEEEFYYTEVEIPNVLPRTRAYTEPASQMANLSLADHLDMARPAHEDPEITRAVSGFRSKMRSLSGTQPSMTATGNKSGSLLINQFQGSPASLTTPITIAPSVVKRIYIFSEIRISNFLLLFQGSPGKYILISPPGENNVSSSAPTHGSSMLKSPGHRRIREGKKCRKVYGLEQRDLWCTQCKWKKACARFGKPSSASSTQNNAANNAETSPTSLLIPAHSQQNAVRAIKF